MGLTLTEKIIKNHIVEGEMVKGSEIGLRIHRPNFHLAILKVVQA